MQYAGLKHSVVRYSQRLVWRTWLKLLGRRRGLYGMFRLNRIAVRFGLGNADPNGSACRLSAVSACFWRSSGLKPPGSLVGYVVCRFKAFSRPPACILCLAFSPKPGKPFLALLWIAHSDVRCGLRCAVFAVLRARAARQAVRFLGVCLSRLAQPAAWFCSAIRPRLSRPPLMVHIIRVFCIV